MLVAIDHDTRYQAVADESGEVARDFPVYGTASEGAHGPAVLRAVGPWGRGAVTEHTVLDGETSS